MSAIIDNAKTVLLRHVLPQLLEKIAKWNEEMVHLKFFVLQFWVIRKTMISSRVA